MFSVSSHGVTVTVMQHFTAFVKCEATFTNFFIKMLCFASDRLLMGFTNCIASRNHALVSNANKKLISITL
jgi:hypothetical protein